ncbi:SLAM family member 9 isoform X1 [Kryptolebias marmoratus]|uniref:SLAM family member 9 isoform X1 n=1 Tax=Kryptolebias marmoratus TaxID=37003 RepID=UPI000D52F406|nr:SLAM family member 9 isoform X1 [Kryptolebias marmoratus]
MVGGRGRLRCLSCFFFPLSTGLLLGVCLHSVEASGGNRVINKKVGDSVELSPNVSPEGITDVHWKYGSTVVAYKETGVPKNNPFQDRLEFNKNNFSLTLRNLKIQDSGDFIFISELRDKQRPAIIITLKVYEAVTTKPILTSKVLHSTVNGSCTVLLDCNLTSDINVSYSVTVGNQTHRVSSLQYTIRPEDGATTFTCRVSNPVSEMSAFKTVTCKPASDKDVLILNAENQLLWILAAAGGFLILLIIIATVCFCLCKQRRSGSDSNELTVYADISDFTVEEGPSATSKPCSLYDTIEDRTQTAVPQGPQTVYDKIQFDRMRTA